ncbi:MAG: TetR/AcrR family transcriptional regulator [Prevotella sp.]|uniref:TetR/AcrR family transcriptional regulator n=1 Tax=Prevotella sp. TaxID=59823 RepID=UPI002A28D7F3|nr:TetR/AcrR family transcriptional regulator [Prevotella sp.]MDD7318645.1 TetR/AcrR family transcriptional regulator [Prevotellaceae bacterium]MDY4019399.1 TetR/AcrR family transcriptional regulator [Prevotella sp.]
MQNNNVTDYKKELRHKILSTAMEMFKKHGIRSVKMDDIANALQISKRTLYEIYENKETLLFECVREDHIRARERMQQYALSAENEMDIIIGFFNMKMKDLGQIDPKFFAELHKYTNIMTFLRSSHEEERSHAKAFIESGVEHGYFVEGLNYDIVLKLGEASMNYIMENKLYLRYEIQDIFRNFCLVLVRGFCTPKGIERLNGLFGKP